MRRWRCVDLAVAMATDTESNSLGAAGAREKQQNAGVDYYESLVEQSETTDSASFRQIELDIDRTFGHSGTKICTDAGRSVLRRVLRAYSLRNASVGYCQVRSIVATTLLCSMLIDLMCWFGI